VHGGIDDDIVSGDGGQDDAFGDDDDDEVRGGGGRDFLHGSAGKDDLSGGAGNDQLNADAGEDNLSGGTGNDTGLFGGEDRDRIDGGPGTDTPCDPGPGRRRRPDQELRGSARGNIAARLSLVRDAPCEQGHGWPRRAALGTDGTGSHRAPVPFIIGPRAPRCRAPSTRRA
jgi:Ca2+-binding RTX toxin-like protein